MQITLLFLGWLLIAQASARYLDISTSITTEKIHTIQASETSAQPQQFTPIITTEPAINTLPPSRDSPKRSHWRRDCNGANGGN
jgi:hypothetical protein